MRLYLLPISTRRTLLYAHRLNLTTTSANTNYVDKGAAWAARKWADWERRESGWQKKVVEYGNQAFRRIPYEEWGLKSVPPLSARRRAEELQGNDKVELVFPASLVSTLKAEGLVRTLATERQGLHRRMLTWSFVGMPITAPFALVPIIPNLPFFYLVYRAWSHWRALAGGKHIQWLTENRLLLPSPSEELDKLYRQDAPPTVEGVPEKEQMLLTQSQIRNFSKALDVPALEIELERAVWQVEQAIAAEASRNKEPAGETRQAGAATNDDASSVREEKKEQ